MFRHLLGYDHKLRSLRRAVRAPSRRQRSCRPLLERLEERLAPATHFWSGEGDPGQQHKWSNDDNWDNGAPGGDPNAVLDYPSDVYLYNGSSSDDYPGELSIRSIVFHRAGYFVGNALGSSAYLIDNVGALNEDGDNVLHLDMRLPDGQHVFEVDGGYLELSGRLTGGGEISKEGVGSLVLDGDARDYYGFIVVNEGAVELRFPNVLSSYNAISVRENGGLELTAGDYTLQQLGDVRGQVELFEGANLTLEGGITHFYKGLSGDDIDRGLNLTGNARVTLDAYNSFEGPVRISSGTLQMDGTLNPHATHWTVDQGGRLTGRGEVPDVLVSGSVIPGDPPEEPGSAPGVLSTNNVTFLPGSVFAARLNGYEQGGIHGYDQLRVLGRVDLSGSPKLNASVGFASKPGDSFTILTSTDGITGTFAGLPDGTNFGIDGVPMQIHYTATSVVLTHQPQFLAPVYYAAKAPNSVAVGDFNGDGISDLVVGNFTDDGVNVLLGSGDGTFGNMVPINMAPITLPHGAYPLSVAVGHFHDPNILDFAVTTYDHKIYVVLGNGDGTFQTPVPYPDSYPAGSVSQPTSLEVGDLNGDGNQDLVLLNSYDHTVSILYGNGDGTFEKIVDLDFAGHLTTAVALADLNGDGKLDLIVAIWSAGGGGLVSVLTNDGNDAAGHAVFRHTADDEYRTGGDSVGSLALADFDGDGQLDVLAGSGYRVDLLMGNGDGTFQRTPKSSAVGFYGVGALVVADFDGDGKADVAVTADHVDGNGSRGVALLYGKGNGYFQTPGYYDFGGRRSIAEASGDFNGDGHPDLAATLYEGNIGILINRGDGTVPPPGGSAGRKGPGPMAALFPAGVDAALKAWPSSPTIPASALPSPPALTASLEVAGLERFFAAAAEQEHGFAWFRSKREAWLSAGDWGANDVGKAAAPMEPLSWGSAFQESRPGSGGVRLPCVVRPGRQPSSSDQPTNPGGYHVSPLIGPRS